MQVPVILASSSTIRQEMLRNAGVDFDVEKPMVDEESILASMGAEGATPRDIADTLAEHKGTKVSLKNPGRWTIGCDQVLDLKGQPMQKPDSRDAAVEQLRRLSGQRHKLFSAAVICEDGKPIWRHIGVVRLHMRDLSPRYIDGYVERNWESIQHAVGCYKLEEEGVRLFSRIVGDYFTVLGLPLVELLGYLTLRGVLDG